MKPSHVPVAILSLLAGLSGCTITQTADPVMLHGADALEMCVIEDPQVDEAGLPAYATVLERKGFSVDVLAPEAPVTSCPFTSTYDAKWSWEFVRYMSHAVVVVYRDGHKAGEAIYGAPESGRSITPRIYKSTESKLGEMVDDLFPAL